MTKKPRLRAFTITLFALAATFTIVQSASASSTAVTSAQAASNNDYYEVQVQTNPALCLDANTGDTGGLYAGDPVQLWTCNHRSNQHWELVNPWTGSGAAYIENMDQNQGTFCLAIPNNSTSGTTVVIEPCSGASGFNLHWGLGDTRGGNPGYHMWRNEGSANECLDAQNAFAGEIAPGDQIQAWLCNGHSDEFWYSQQFDQFIM